LHPSGAYCLPRGYLSLPSPALAAVSIVTSIVNDLDETVDAGRNFKLNLVHALDAKHFACNHALALSRSVCTRLDVCKYLCIHVHSGYLPRIEDNGREPRFLVMQRTCQPVRSNLRRTICRVGEEEDVGQLSRLRAHSRPLGVCALLESGKRGLEECYQAVDVGLYLSSQILDLDIGGFGYDHFDAGISVDNVDVVDAVLSFELLEGFGRVRVYVRIHLDEN
jgi:hypothetical protein